jgi:hypothetical protein
VNIGGGVLFRGAMKTLVWLLALASPWMSGAGAAHACSCERTSPAAGFDRAQYVFTGKVVEAGSHTWVVEVDRVWKGKEKLRRSERLMDAYAAMDCEFFFKLGERYLFFAIVAKSGRDVFYHPQVCNLTSPLRSNRVVTPEGVSLWLEDFIVREHGPGERPRDGPGSMRLP